jgi:hypothetical protein
MGNPPPPKKKKKKKKLCGGGGGGGLIKGQMLIKGEMIRKMQKYRVWSFKNLLKKPWARKAQLPDAVQIEIY